VRDTSDAVFVGFSFYPFAMSSIASAADTSLVSKKVKFVASGIRIWITVSDTSLSTVSFVRVKVAVLLF